MDPADIIQALGMQPHPEGGWYVETFRDAPEGGRGYSSAIYFLLEHGQVSAWHRVKDAAEVWHFYAGSALSLSVRKEGEATLRHILGPDLRAGQRPQLVVPANWWQTAESLGDWTLVGCTVAPGFDFATFELAPPGWEPPEGVAG
jgi:predicted cupin superfamily sugar epimerase